MKICSENIILQPHMNGNKLKFSEIFKLSKNIQPAKSIQHMKSIHPRNKTRFNKAFNKGKARKTSNA